MTQNKKYFEVEVWDFQNVWAVIILAILSLISVINIICLFFWFNMTESLRTKKKDTQSTGVFWNYKKIIKVKIK